MSYASLGFIWFPTAKAADACTGEVWSWPDQDEQCSRSTWTNAVVRREKGLITQRYYDESKLRAVIADLIRELPSIEYDEKAKPVAGLMAGLLRTQKNYAALYPKSRWRKSSGCAGTAQHCPGDGWSLWQVPSSVSATVATTEAHKAAKAEVLAAFKDWSNFQYRAELFSNLAPGTRPGDRLSTGISWQGAYYIKDGVIRPAPWLQDFMDTYAPGWSKAPAKPPSPIFSKALVSLFKAPVQSAARPDEPDTSVVSPPDEPTKPPLSMGAKVAVAGAALVVSGLAIFAAT